MIDSFKAGFLLSAGVAWFFIIALVGVTGFYILSCIFLIGFGIAEIFVVSKKYFNKRWKKMSLQSRYGDLLEQKQEAIDKTKLKIRWLIQRCADMEPLLMKTELIEIMKELDLQ